MQIDYKRDLNHTYVILQEEKEPDTASYQIRMLLTNAIPGLLDCKIRKMDVKIEKREFTATLSKNRENG